MSGQRFKRALWVALAGLFLLGGLLSAALGLLLYHPAGPQWGLALIRSLTPLAIEVENLEGRLAGPLSIRGLHIDDEQFTLQSEALSLDWRPAALLRGEFHLQTFSVERTRLQLPAAESAAAPSPSAGFDGIALPLALRLDQLELSALEIARQGREPLQFERLALSARSQDEGLELQQLALAMPQLALQAQGRLGLDAALPMNLSLAWRFTPPQRPSLQGEGGITGNLRQLQIEQTFSGALSGGLTATLYDLMETINWDARIKLQQSELAAWLEGFPLSLSGELSSKGRVDRVGLQAELSLSQPNYGEAHLSLQGAYAAGRFAAERLQIETPAGSHLMASGHYIPDQALGRFQADLSWQDLRWPLQSDTPDVRSPRGSLKLAGTPAAYDFTLAAALQLAGQPATELDARGNGDRQGIKLDALLADFEPGRLQGQGELTWQPMLGWKLELEAEDIDPSRWHADYPGRLRLSAETEGRVDTAGVAAEFRLAELLGRLRGYPFEAQGSATLAGQALTLDDLRISSGANRVAVTGEVAQTLALSWQIDAPELQAFWPGLEGKLSAQGRLDGRRETPRLRASLSGQGLKFKNNRAEQLQLTTDLSLAGDQALTLELHSDGLATEAGNWRRLDLQASGTLPAHSLELALVGEAVPQVRLRADAGWGDERLWQGRLEGLELSLPDQPAWQLAKHSAFALGVERQRLDELCLSSGEAGLCGAFSRDLATGWEASLTARRFPLALLSPWLPEGLQLDGSSELQAQLAADAEGQPRGQWQLRTPEGRIGLDLESEAEQIDFAGAEVVGRIDDAGAEMSIELPLAGLGKVEGELALPAFNPLALRPAEQRLQGRLSLELSDLSRLSLISPRLRNPRGVIAGDFTLAGSLQSPQLLGSADLREGAIDIPELGLELRDIVLQLHTPSDDRLALQGGLRSGNGRLQLNGELNLDAQTGFPASLQLNGTEVTVANLPEAEVEVTPSLTLERDSQAIRLKGRIEIPYARLRPRELPSSAVSVSTDLVVVGGDEPQQRAFDPRLSAKLRVVLGDRVSFDGFGLRGKLIGSLLVIDEPERPVIGRGRIGISEGTYRAYGQDLSIERGYALFVDSPVHNPGLDVRAVREIEEVIAGVRVGGTLMSPKIDLFSSPRMGESDILSYLLTGRPAGEGGGQSVGIAAALKATGAGTVAEELGRQFGLEELRLDAGSGLEEASVVAGTYLSPRLYIQYINELASRETKLRMRYDINRRLQLEAETGKTQAGDLYYTFDR
jgi:translocation and assembly module TamB